jgi:hypothetical protein
LGEWRKNADKDEDVKCGHEDTSGSKRDQTERS